jgi:hypothetical protein
MFNAVMCGAVRWLLEVRSFNREKGGPHSYYTLRQGVILDIVLGACSFFKAAGRSILDVIVILWSEHLCSDPTLIYSSHFLCKVFLCLLLPTTVKHLSSVLLVLILCLARQTEQFYHLSNTAILVQNCFPLRVLLIHYSLCSPSQSNSSCL